MFENTESLNFTVDVLHVGNSGLPRVRPDKDGYYCNFPICALGKVSRNKTYYYIKEFTDQITNNKSFFNMALTSQTLTGEWGHPKVMEIVNSSPSVEKMLRLRRLVTIDEDKISHHFKSIRTGKQLEGGGKLLLADIRPFGPYKDMLKDSLDSPHINTSFSLRAISKDKVENNILKRRIVKLVTFDYVNTPGYNEASKKFAEIAKECINIGIEKETSISRMDEMAFESLSNSELSEMLKTDKIYRVKKSTTFVKNDSILDNASTRFDVIYKEVN